MTAKEMAALRKASGYPVVMCDACNDAIGTACKKCNAWRHLLDVAVQQEREIADERNEVINHDSRRDRLNCPTHRETTMRTLFGVELARITSVNGIRLWPGTLQIIAEGIGVESMLQADIYDGPDMRRLRINGDAQARKPERLLMLASRATSIAFEQE